MKYLDEFRKRKSAEILAGKIRALKPPELRFMEVCGTHTQSFFRFGLAKLLPPQLRLISGPGCPVCVSTQGYIDAAVGLAGKKDLLIVSFADMLRVPGSSGSLEDARARKGNVRVVYSPLEALEIARAKPGKKVVFLAVGFETTAAPIALTVSQARRQGMKNIFFLSALKLIPPAMEFLLRDKALRLNGFLCPGHVSAIIGSGAYEFIPRKYKLGCCVSGFEPLDLLESIYLLIRQAVQARPKVENEYGRLVRRLGNRRALKAISEVFEKTDALWRGLGRIKASGLRLRKRYSQFDAAEFFSLGDSLQQEKAETKGCRCGEVLKGLISPRQCPLFGRGCTPQRPLGACMVSSEGACNAYYRYG